ncbi:MAG: TolC family protein, partial [Deltaproteobacteria bacterium]|nr:TolC family protein [Deltaproteobacteria bacterium]
MQKKFIFLLLIIIVSLPGWVSAAEKSYTLEQCLEMALTRNPLVLASVERKIQAEWGKKSAFDDFLPKLNVDASYSYTDSDYDVDIGMFKLEDNRSRYGARFYIDQPLFTGFRLTETYNLADIGFKVAVAGEQLANLEIIFQTISAYYDFLMNQKLQRVANAAVTQLTSHLNDSEQFYKNEIIPLNDLLESKVHLANARQDARIAASLTRTARMALATIIREPLQLRFNVEDTP